MMECEKQRRNWKGTIRELYRSKLRYFRNLCDKGNGAEEMEMERRMAEN
jgi:hypothetical protein